MSDLVQVQNSNGPTFEMQKWQLWLSVASTAAAWIGVSFLLYSHLSKKSR